MMASDRSLPFKSNGLLNRPVAHDKRPGPPTLSNLAIVVLPLDGESRVMKTSNFYISADFATIEDHPRAVASVT